MSPGLKKGCSYDTCQLQARGSISTISTPWLHLQQLRARHNGLTDCLRMLS